MLTETVSPEFARQIEFAEANAWLDQWEAFAVELVRQYRFGKQKIGEAVMLTSPVIQFSHFNRVMGFGLTKPATEKELDEILAIFSALNVSRFELQVIPHTRPLQLVDWMRERGLRVLSGWDRIYRGNEPLADKTELPAGMRVEKITLATIEELSTFLVNMYRWEPTKPLLCSLVERKGWHHYVLREDEKIVVARSMFIDHGGIAWWGIEAPVPGIMTPRFDLDYHLCREMIKDGLRLDAKYFIADIEKPDEKMNHDGYRNFDAMAFKRAYFRANYSF